MKTVPEMLENAAQIYRERNQLYGDNYKHTGYIFHRLFPNNITLKTPEDFNRFTIFVLIIVKITRYAMNFKDGHNDSLDDIAVYSMMLRELDNDIRLS